MRANPSWDSLHQDWIQGEIDSWRKSPQTKTSIVGPGETNYELKKVNKFIYLIFSCAQSGK